MAVAHIAPGDDIIGKVLNIAHITLLYSDFQAVVMVDVYVQCIDGQIVMMLGGDNPAGQIAFLMLIDISQHSKSQGRPLIQIGKLYYGKEDDQA